ncbi:MAG: hypothetical protein RML95_15490, partial [Anaerolineae bacterium]|nr:hypothetical protein [Anaerolineae bacterium]
MRVLRQRSYLVDGLIILALFVFFVVACLLRIEFEWNVRYNDGWWYLNRAWLHSHGVFDEVSFYTLVYPLLVGAVNQLIGDPIAAALVVNAVSQLFLLVGVYFLGKLLVNRAVGVLSVFLLALNPSNLHHARFIGPDLLFTAAAVWIVVLAVQLVRQPSKPLVGLLAVLLAIIVFIRAEGVAYSLVILFALTVLWRRQRDYRSVVSYLLIPAPIVGVAWLTYFVLFFSAADKLGEVQEALPLIFNIQDNVRTYQLRRTLELLEWQLNRSDWLVLLLGFVALRAKVPRGVLLLLPLLALIFLYITFAPPFPLSRYTLQLVPYLVVILSAFLVRMTQRFPLSIITAATLILCVYSAFVTLQKLPAPLAYRDDPQAMMFRQAVDELAQWREANGYKNTTIYTICTDLMIFAQYDVRLPYTALLFSSRRFAPPEQVLPQIAAQNGLLLVCPTVITELAFHPFNAEWMNLYLYWHNPETARPDLA